MLTFNCRKKHYCKKIDNFVDRAYDFESESMTPLHQRSLVYLQRSNDLWKKLIKKFPRYPVNVFKQQSNADYVSDFKLL